MIKISIAGPADTNAIRDVHYKSWLANTAKGDAGLNVDVANNARSLTSCDGETLSKEDKPKRNNDAHRLQKNPPRESETVVAKLKQEVIGFCTVIRGSEQNNLAEIYIVPKFQGKKIGRKLWDSARQFIDENKDTTVALLRCNVPAKKFYEGIGFTETGVSWEGEGLENADGSTVIEMILRGGPQ